jgi:hypothetical protein
LIALPSDKQTLIESECQTIDAMACQGGVTALTDEADFHQDSDFPAQIAKLDSFHGKVMWAFLEYPPYWAGAMLFLHSDNVAETLWKKRKDLPKLAAHLEPEDTEQLAQSVIIFTTKKDADAIVKLKYLAAITKNIFSLTLKTMHNQAWNG